MSKATGRYNTIIAGAIMSVLVLMCPLAAAEQTEDLNAGEGPSLTQPEAPTTEQDSSANNVQGEGPIAATPAAVSPLTPTKLPLSSTPKINSGANLMNLMLGLLLIIGLIFALAWLVRRMGQGGLLGHSAIKVVAAMPLGTRERLLVVDVGGQQLLLGITSTQINTLHVFPEPVIETPSAGGQSEFGKKLMAILQQKSPSPISTSRDPAPESKV